MQQSLNLQKKQQPKNKQTKKLQKTKNAKLDFDF